MIMITELDTRNGSIPMCTILATAPDGLYRLPLSLEGGSVTLGRPVLQWSSIQSERHGFEYYLPHPDGTRSLGGLPEEFYDDARQPSLVIKTGWVQHVAEQLRNAR